MMSAIRFSPATEQLAVGASLNNGSARTRPYAHLRLEWRAWVQRGSDIDGEAARDYFGSSVSLSSDGAIVAIGSGKSTEQGRTSIYAWNGTAWVQRSDIDGEAVGDRSGANVSLSATAASLLLDPPTMAVKPKGTYASTPGTA